MKKVTKHILTLLLISLLSATAFSFPKLNSHPSATATIFLDMDGHTVNSAYWNGGNPIVCASPLLSEAQIIEIFNRVSEDYRPFDINITTDSIKFLAAPLTQRIRVIVTPTSGWRSGVGGIAYIGSFTWGDDTPAFVFSDRLGPNNAKYIAECCSHESGHTVGLSHQSSYDGNCNLVETYNTGTGLGETGWAPVMGNSYYKNMTGWNDGPTPYGCANVQDNLTIITSANGFGYRTDDYSETMDTNTFNPGNESFSANGIISNSTDKDAFKFTLSQNAPFHFDATPFSLGANNAGANLDIKVTIYNESLQLIQTYDPVTSMSVTIDTNLLAGTYYFVVDGSGNNNTSNYGSLGSYSVTGFKGALPIRDVRLSGRVNKNKHQLSWTIVADEPIKTQIVESSADGVIYKPLSSETIAARSTTFDAIAQPVTYYRLRVTSIVEQTVYSNVIALTNNEKEEKIFTVSTFINNQIAVTSLENYQYRITDVNGRLIASGRGNKGFNSIEMSRQSAGLYILQFLYNHQLHTERIIKQ